MRTHARLQRTFAIMPSANTVTDQEGRTIIWRSFRSTVKRYIGYELPGHASALPRRASLTMLEHGIWLTTPPKNSQRPTTKDWEVIRNLSSEPLAEIQHSDTTSLNVLLALIKKASQQKCLKSAAILKERFDLTDRYIRSLNMYLTQLEKSSAYLSCTETELMPILITIRYMPSRIPRHASRPTEIKQYV